MELEFETIVERYAPALYRLAFSFCGSRQDAEDMVQETFLKYLRAKPHFRDEAALGAWLRRVTANGCRDLLRSAARRRNVPLERAAPVAAGDDPCRAPDVARALEQLAARDRAIIYLFYYEQRPTREIAALLDMTDVAVRSRLRRARSRLKDLLGGDDNGT